MKKLFVFILWMSLFWQGNAQYDFSITYSMVIDPGKAQQKELSSLLHIRPPVSLFIYNFDKNGSNPDPILENGFSVYRSDSTGYRYFLNTSDSIMIFRELQPISAYVKQKAPEISWHITKETKQLLGMECIRAECFYHGRSYIAWFTPSIPVSAGPWKLWGLPGLILHVADQEKKISFTATAIHELSLSEVLGPPLSQLYLNEEEYIDSIRSLFYNFKRKMERLEYDPVQDSRISISLEIDLLERFDEN